VIEAPPVASPPPPPPRRRRSWGLWLAVFIFGFLFLVTTMFYALFQGLGTVTPSVSRGSAVTIDLARPYPEDPLYRVNGPFVDVQNITFRELLLAIRNAKDDARIDKLFIRVRGTRLGWGNAFELRSALVDFKLSTKPVVAFIEYAGNRDYYLASAADEVYLHPRGSIDLRGIRAELLFVKAMLDKIGVEAEFERFGAYKDAPDMFLRENMSNESREAIGELVDTIHGSLVEGLAEGRGVDVATMEALVAKGPFTAEEALEHGLVDGLRYIDEVRDGLAPEGEKAKTVAVAGYRRASGGSRFGTKGRIAIVYGIGAIVGGGSGEDAMFGRVMGSETIGEAFRKVREDESIDAVVFRIDSPGGSDVASDVIWREAMLTRKEKPVVVSMANVAASGGYWIAMASDTVVAEPTTITGSIGIYGGKFNLRGLYGKIGLSHDGVSSAPNADFFSDSRSFTEEERARFRHMIETGYRAFLDRVAEARGMTTDEVHAVAQGRVWSGRSALDHGLVDELGGLSRALEIAKEKAGFGRSDRVELVVYPEKKSLFEVLISNFLGARSSGGALDALAPGKLLERSPLLRSLATGKPLALMPYRLELN